MLKLKFSLLGILFLLVNLSISGCPGRGDPNSICTPTTDYVALVTNPQTNELWVVELLSNRVTEKFPTGRNPVEIAVSPDNRLVLVSNSGDNTVTAFKHQDRGQLLRLGDINVGNGPNGITFSPTASEAYVAVEGDGLISILNTRDTNVSPQQIGNLVLPRATGEINPPRPNKVAIYNNVLFVTDISGNGKIQPFIINSPGRATAGSPWIAPASQPTRFEGVTTDKSGNVYVSDRLGDSILAFSGSSAQSGGLQYMGRVKLVDPNFQSGRIGPTRLTVSPTNKLYIAGTDSNSIFVINITQPIQGDQTITNIGKVISLSPFQNARDSSRPAGISVSVDGTQVYVGNGGGMPISLIDGNSDILLRNIGLEVSQVSQPTISDIKFLGTIVRSQCLGTIPVPIQ